MRIVWKSAITVLIIIAGSELIIRASGITDFPLYEANKEIGYIPKPSQAGSFLHKNSWEFNSLSMGAGQFTPTNGIDTLLIGDSIVLGGNPYKQQDRLGPTLQTETKHAVWPISAGSWSLSNELIYLKIHQDILKDIDDFIFVLNSEDFQQPSSWSCETTHPRTYPFSATYYAFKKYIYDFPPCTNAPNELTVAEGDWKADLKDFLRSEVVKGKPVSFFLYPNKKESAGKPETIAAFEKHAADLLQASNGNARVFSIYRDPRWNSQFYRDGIHPTIEGTKVLASIINSPDKKTELKQAQ